MRIEASKLGKCLIIMFSVLLVTSSCSQDPIAKLEDYLPMYQGWCAYNLEVGSIKNTLDGCVQDMWNAGQNGSKPLHRQFESMQKMNEYIAFDSGLRVYCDLMKDSPTQFEELLGLTRIGDLSYEECKDQLIQLNKISSVLELVRYDPARSRGWTYEPGVTYRIGGDVYNDPFGLDYKNGPSDVFGDGK